MIPYVRAGIAIAIALICGSPGTLAVCIYNGELYAKTSVSQELRDAKLVIRGKVVANRDIGIPDADQDMGVVSRIQVEQIFKGTSGKIITYYSRRDSGGFYLDIGKDYLLFLDPISGTEWAKDYPGAMVVNYDCGQSRPWDEVPAADLETLRSGNTR